MMKPLLTGTGILMLMFAIGCGKDEAPSPACELNSASLAGRYKVTLAQYQADAFTPPVLDTDFDSCEATRIYFLDSTGTYTETIGDDCGEGVDGTWQLTNDSTLAITDPSIPSVTVYVLKDFNCNAFKRKYYSLSGGDYFIRTFTRQ